MPLLLIEPLLSIDPLWPLLIEPLELPPWPELPPAPMLPLAEPPDVCAKQPSANIMVMAINNLFIFVLLKERFLRLGCGFAMRGFATDFAAFAQFSLRSAPQW